MLALLIRNIEIAIFLIGVNMKHFIILFVALLYIFEIFYLFKNTFRHI